jgi:Bacterial protein of unknown function (DUF937)/PRC-barrel domain
MPTNLVSSVTKVLTPDLLARVASGLGIDRALVEKGSSASVPALLAALTSLVAKPGGAAKLSDVVAQQQPGILTSIANVIGGSGQKELADSGLGALSSLLGGSTVSALTSAVSKYSGLGDNGSKSLMGLIGPLLMGVLGQQQRASGLDASALADLLRSQKDNIVRALPPGFAKYLSGTGILDRVTGPLAQEVSTREADYSSSLWSWALPLLGLVAIGALAWHLLARSPTETVATVAPSKVETTAQAPTRAAFVVKEDEAKNWIGRPVFSSDNKKIGELIEIKRAPDNRVTDVYVDTGTFLGIGANLHRITSEQIQEVKPDGLVLTLKESEVQSVPQAGDK